MSFPKEDRAVLRDLAAEVMEIARLPVQDEKREMWRKVNGLEDVRPMVWINELPWGELAADEELAGRCSDRTCAGIEYALRRTLYLWRHMRCDMVVDPFFVVPFVYSDSGYGIQVKAQTGASSEGHGFGSRDYEPLIRDEADIDLIRMPVIEADWDETERRASAVADLLGDAMPVRKQGQSTLWFSPWDQLVQWYGVTELMMDMVDRPEFVNRAVSRMVDAMVCRLDQLLDQGLLSVTNNNHRVGSGGLGITDQLPQPDHDGGPARTMDLWGTATGQIFSEVSPAMHWEFCLQHEMRWLERFGLNCYGCCEPLHNKMGILARIPRLRRVSMSTWVDVEKGAEALGRDYVFSYKPNPSVVAWDEWDSSVARNDIRRVLAQSRGCVRELIMKDVSTCRNEPRRIWEWCDVVMDAAVESG